MDDLPPLISQAVRQTLQVRFAVQMQARKVHPVHRPSLYLMSKACMEAPERSKQAECCMPARMPQTDQYWQGKADFIGWNRMFAPQLHIALHRVPPGAACIAPNRDSQARRRQQDSAVWPHSVPLTAPRLREFSLRVCSRAHGASIGVLLFKRALPAYS